MKCWLARRGALLLTPHLCLFFDTWPFRVTTATNKTDLVWPHVPAVQNTQDADRIHRYGVDRNIRRTRTMAPSLTSKSIRI